MANNKHSFESKKIDTHNLESTNNYSHSFLPKLLNSRFFEIIITGYIASSTWFLKFTQSIPITISAIKSIIYPRITIIQRSEMLVNRLLVNIKSVPTIKIIIANTITFSEKLYQKMGSVTVTITQNIISTLKDLLKIGSVPSITVTNTLVLVPTYKKYYLLSYWDTFDLTDMNELDVKNLSDMDYQVV